MDKEVDFWEMCTDIHSHTKTAKKTIRGFRRLDIVYYYLVTRV